MKTNQVIAQAACFADADRLHRLLHAALMNAGCFRAAPMRSALYGVFILGLYGAAYASLLTQPEAGVRLLAIAVLAFASVHAGFLAHELGHGAVTRDRRLAQWIGQVFNTLLTALCYSYFRHIHSSHHPHCNDRSLDPDMQSGVFSLYRESAQQKRGFGRFVSRHQAFLIWILVWLQGFTLKIDSLKYLRANPRATRLDRWVLVGHVALWIAPTLALGAADALLNYGLMTLLIGPYLGAIFLVNHIGTRVIEPEERLHHFFHEVAVTRNLGDSRLQDFLFGGLNNHIEHHLFPSIPTVRLRAARRITRDFCRRNGVVYQEMSWFAAAREVTRHFRAMSAFGRP
jgi:fatty acid desaturase